MKSLDCSLFTHFGRSRTVSGVLLGLGCVMSALTGFGQAVVSTPPSTPSIPAAVPQQPASDSAEPTFGAFSPFQFGIVTLHPHISYRFLYGDGIQATPGKQSSTSIQTISPGVLMNIGTHWTLDYTPTKTYYSDSAFKDTLDHSVNLIGGGTSQDWIFQIAQTYTSSNDPLIETGQQTSEDDFGTLATATYRFSDRVQIDSSLNYLARFSTSFPDSKEIIWGERGHYKFTSQLDAAAGVDVGYANVSVGADMTYTRPNVQLTWKPTEKTEFGVQTGFENRKFREKGIDDLNSPTYGATAKYAPFTTTTINFALSRAVSVSRLSSQVTRGTSWTLDLQQRLLQHYYLSAGYSGQKARYISTDPLLSVSRSDENYSFNVRLSTVLFQRATVAVLYQNSHNKSNDAGFGFSSSQVGLELGYRY